MILRSDLIVPGPGAIAAWLDCLPIGNAEPKRTTSGNFLVNSYPHVSPYPLIARSIVRLPL